MKTLDDFHDGFLDGLLIQDATAHLFLSTGNKQEFVLKVSEVLSLKLDGFRQGNIIYDVLIRNADELTLQDIMYFYEFKDGAKAAKKLEELRETELVVLEVNPSYGAQCLILARSVDVSQRESRSGTKMG